MVFGPVCTTVTGVLVAADVDTDAEVALFLWLADDTSDALGAVMAQQNCCCYKCYDYWQIVLCPDISVTDLLLFNTLAFCALVSAAVCSIFVFLSQCCMRLYSRDSQTNQQYLHCFNFLYRERGTFRCMILSGVRAAHCLFVSNGETERETNH